MWQIGLFAVVLLVGGNCMQAQRLSPEAQAQWTRDSLDYERRLAKWIYDSTAIDSIERSVKTDSLAHLYERMLASEMPGREMQLIFCEQVRIGVLYGSTPMLHVSNRIRDSMYAAAGGAAVARMQRRLPQSGRITSSACPKSETRPMVVTPGGTRLDVNLYRPRPPTRP